MSHHVVVVGAGPAGRACAIALARAGRAVTLLDRHRSVGHKACAGVLPGTAWEEAGINLDSDAVSTFHRHLRVVSPLGDHTVRLDDPFLAVIDRPTWAASQLEMLAGLGVRLQLGNRLLSLSDTAVHTDAGPIECTHVVGADGSASRVRRLLGLGSGPARLISFQVIAQTSSCAVDREPTVYFDPRRFAAGYGWIFPTEDSLRIGCCAPCNEIAPQALRRSLNNWVQLLDPECVATVQKGASIACGYVGHRFGRFYLAGDAAGLASPVTGEGIYQAMVSGREIAREIIDPDYRSAAIRQLATRHNRTRSALSHRSIGGPALSLAPYLLRWSPLRRFVWDRYVL